jgi:hypothetical protein
MKTIRNYKSAFAGEAKRDGRVNKWGFTLIELIVAMTTSSIVILTAGMLINSGYRSWTRSFNYANCESRLGALDTMVALGAIGRKSNKMDYRLYEVSGSVFTRAGTTAGPEEVVTGQAIEFRYWDTDLSPSLMNPNTTATAYALFYLSGGDLKVDYGSYDPPGAPGAIDGTGHRNTAGITTVTLTHNVTSVEFSHTTKNGSGDGQGCVRMKLIIPDSTDGSAKTTLAATFMRNVWPQ